ncbi:hypothetical protein [Devosia sp.]|uniref:hypothetical protein n=1 Tax=Devosia sp. TaxID=1871048 RepID=UPI001AD0333D|nr:hypothetical protein [Devosia sp.]MBN9336009.1 hypothetical protein [Devosia sp.]
MELKGTEMHGEGKIYVPISKDLYNDIVRFSDGQIRPETVAEDLLLRWVADSAQAGDEHWGKRKEEVLGKYATANVIVDWAIPLVWKGLNFPEGTEVRMSYGGSDYFAKVMNGKVVDRDGSFSPSEWASKIAQGTSRNAWRDLWLRLPGAPNWVQATQFRSRSENEPHAFRSTI